MPANSSGWFWHCLARETGRIGHLFSPGAQRGPWPWFPYALDNGAFSCWDQKTNVFDGAKWAEVYPLWKDLIYWAATASQKPRWAIVPDMPGNAAGTLTKYTAHAREVRKADIPIAIAVQDGMTKADVWKLDPQPEVVCVGGSTDWKWSTVEHWAGSFPRVHVLRCNMPDKLTYLEDLGVESCDGTGWARGNRLKQTLPLERWARERARPTTSEISLFTCKKPQRGQMEWSF